MKKPLSKMTQFLVALVIILAIGVYAVRDYRERYRPLSDQEVKAKIQACEAMTPKAADIIKKIQSRGRRTTDPRVFYNRRVNRCLYTYLMIDPKGYEPTTYNTFIIKDLETNRTLYMGETNLTPTWIKYLEVMDKLEK